MKGASERERVAEWLRRLTRKPKVRTAVGSNPTLDSLVAVRYTSPGRPEPCEGNLVAVAGSCGGVMVKHPWPLLEISLSDFRGLATLNINTYLPTYLQAQVKFKGCEGKNRSLSDAKNLCCSCKLQSCTPYECKFPKLASRSDCYLAKVSGHPISRLFYIRNFKEKWAVFFK